MTRRVRKPADWTGPWGYRSAWCAVYNGRRYIHVEFFQAHGPKAASHAKRLSAWMKRAGAWLEQGKP